jgi:hypothetical protein
MIPLDERCKHQKVDANGDYWDSYCIRKKDHEGNNHLYKSWYWWAQKKDKESVE